MALLVVQHVDEDFLTLGPIPTHSNADQNKSSHSDENKIVTNWNSHF